MDADNLLEEGKHLGAELGVGAGADQDEFDHEEDELVGEAEKHAGGPRPNASTIHGQRPHRPSAEVYPEPASKASNRTDAERYTPHQVPTRPAALAEVNAILYRLLRLAAILCTANASFGLRLGLAIEAALAGQGPAQAADYPS